MANYTIIGGDGKQYGPVTEADLRKWIAEGRLNAQSLAKAESDAEFRPLSAFPELAGAFGAPPPLAAVPPLSAPGGDTTQASDKVRVPAIGLIVSAVISLAMSVYGLLQILFFPPNLQEYQSVLDQLNGSNPQMVNFMNKMIHVMYGPFGIANDLFQVVIAILILLGAIKMLKLRSYEFAFAAAILSVLPCITPCCGWILGLIFGIWAMTALIKVKPYFL